MPVSVSPTTLLFLTCSHDISFSLSVFLSVFLSVAPSLSFSKQNSISDLTKYKLSKREQLERKLRMRAAIPGVPTHSKAKSDSQNHATSDDSSQDGSNRSSSSGRRVRFAQGIDIERPAEEVILERSLQNAAALAATTQPSTSDQTDDTGHSKHSHNENAIELAPTDSNDNHEPDDDIEVEPATELYAPGRMIPSASSIGFFQHPKRTTSVKPNTTYAPKPPPVPKVTQEALQSNLLAVAHQVEELERKRLQDEARQTLVMEKLASSTSQMQAMAQEIDRLRTQNRQLQVQLSTTAPTTYFDSKSNVASMPAAHDNVSARLPPSPLAKKVLDRDHDNVVGYLHTLRPDLNPNSVSKQDDKESVAESAAPQPPPSPIRKLIYGRTFATSSLATSIATPLMTPPESPSTSHTIAPAKQHIEPSTLRTSHSAPRSTVEVGASHGSSLPRAANSLTASTSSVSSSGRRRFLPRRRGSVSQKGAHNISVPSIHHRRSALDQLDPLSLMSTSQRAPVVANAPPSAPTPAVPPPANHSRMHGLENMLPLPTPPVPHPLPVKPTSKGFGMVEQIRGSSQQLSAHKASLQWQRPALKPRGAAQAPQKKAPKKPVRTSAPNVIAIDGKPRPEFVRPKPLPRDSMSFSVFMDANTD
jgi:hypothetical protein